MCPPVSTFILYNFRRYITGVFCVPTNVVATSTCNVTTRNLGVKAFVLGGLVPTAVNGVFNNIVIINFLC